MIKRIATWAVVIALGWTLKFGWNLVTAEPEEWNEAEETAQWIAEEDAWVGEEVATGAAEPARGWLDREKHATFEAPPDQVRDLVDRFHAAGAEDVWMVGIEEFAGARLSDTVAVELPPPGPARDRIFGAEAELWGGEGTPDVGQQYLVVSFD